MLAIRFPVDPPGMVRLVVDDEDIAGTRHFIQGLARVSPVALCPALVHASFLLNLLFALPGQGMPVSDPHLALTQFVEQGRGHKFEGFLVVLSPSRLQSRQPLLHRQPRRND